MIPIVCCFAMCSLPVLPAGQVSKAMEREGERSIEQSLANQMMVADLSTDTTYETPCPAHPDRHGTAVRWFLCHWRPLRLCFAIEIKRVGSFTAERV